MRMSFRDPDTSVCFYPSSDGRLAAAAAAAAVSFFAASEAARVF